MADEKDVIVSAFARSTRQINLADGTTVNLGQFAQPMNAFLEEPELVEVPFEIRAGEGNFAKAFGRTAAKYRDASGAILPKFLASRLRGVQVRRICLIGFSAGGSFLDAVMRGPDAEFVDTVILLDALHLPKAWEGATSFIASRVGPWVNYGVRCARAPEAADGPMLIFAHTEIATPSKLVGSTSQSASEISRQVLKNAPGAVRTGYSPELLLGGPPPPAVSLGPSTGLPPPEVTFDRIPEPRGPMFGNYMAMNFGGRVGASHAFIPWFVQPGIWRALLAPRWNAGLDCAPTSVAGLGQAAEFCGPQGIVVPPGVYDIPAKAKWLHAAAGAAVGIALGVAISRVA